VVAEEKHSQKNEEFEKQEMLKLRILSYNRKEKSLEELSKKFISHFEGRDGLLLELDKVTLCFRVERRRIYDIVNIFESLKVVKKAAKNNYVWRGLKSAI
jgi:transcription factor E2F7/8